MVNSFTFGQYIPGNSLVHSLDPRTKLFCVVIMMTAVLAVNTFIGVMITALFTGIFLVLTRVPVTIYLRGMRPLIILVVITAAFQLFLIPGEVLWRWWVFSITDNGIKMAALMSYRLFMVFVLAQLLTVTTSPLQLTDGLERILRPLARVGFPAHELAMIMTIALRFIPTLIEETDKIMSAQKARGADLESGGLMQRIRALIPIIVPLFVSSFRRAFDLATAMECRCYRGGEGRTRMKQMKMRVPDYISIVVVLAFAAGLLGLNFIFKSVL